MVEKTNRLIHSEGSFYSNKDYEFHDIAEEYPFMTDPELVELGKDIKVNGQKEDIVLFEGLILDGRNRYKGCRKAGATPRFKYYDDLGAPEDFVFSKNFHRRHLTPAQSAKIVIRHLKTERRKARERIERNQLEGKTKNNKPKFKSSACTPEVLADRHQEKGRASQIVAKKFGMSHNTIEKIEKIEKWANSFPEIKKLWEKAKNGKISMAEVDRSVKKLEKIKRSATENPSVGKIWESYLKKEIFLEEANNKFLAVIESQHNSKEIKANLKNLPVSKHHEQILKEERKKKPNQVSKTAFDPKKTYVTLKKEEELQEASKDDPVIRDLWEKVKLRKMSLDQGHHAMQEVKKFKFTLAKETEKKIQEVGSKIKKKTKHVEEGIKRVWTCPLCKGNLLLFWKEEPNSWEHIHLRKKL
ncbi:MAG: hypothetical protein K1060chlam4_00387 [Candidatus Anoxychlamydiales bacterium]|nr:hypothetical protein [Candidatus Anoxychlamydiales bacterium]